jgi:hypothetical protein
LQRQKLGGVSGSQQCSDNICWNLPNRPATCFKKTVSLNLAEFEQFWVDGLELLAQTNPALILSPEAVVFLILQGYMFVPTVAMGLDEPVDRIGIGATAECAWFFGHSG